MDDTLMDEPSMVDTVSVDATVMELLEIVEAVIVDAKMDEPVNVENWVGLKVGTNIFIALNVDTYIVDATFTVFADIVEPVNVLYNRL
jgi:hypothetical protein